MPADSAPAPAALILAAGASSRLGQPKQLFRLAGESLLARSIRVATEAGCTPVVVVLGASAEIITETIAAAGSPGSAIVLRNRGWQEGMASSIRLGIAFLQGNSAAAALLMTCDQPAVTAAHLRALIACARREAPGLPAPAANGCVASSYAGRQGVPAYIPAAHFPLLASLRGDIGARDLLASANSIDLPWGELDIDTPEQAQHATSLWTPLAPPDPL